MNTQNSSENASKMAQPEDNSSQLLDNKPLAKKSRLTWWEIIKFTVITAAIVLPVRYFIAQPFIVSGASMEPNFYEHEYLIVDELSYLFRSPQRGEVVIFRFPENPSMFFIKRIIGLPGETIDIVNGKITITNKQGQSQTLNEPYALGFTTTEINHTTLAADEYFVVGDHREVSYDSRRWGPVKINLIRGRAWLRLLPPTKINYLPADSTNINKQ